MQESGYYTACIGKWHLGWNWAMKDGGRPNDEIEFGEMDDEGRQKLETRIDFSSRIAGGPTDRGFNHYFGVDVPNFPPYTWFEDERISEIPTVPKPDQMYGHAGIAVPDWSLEAVVPELTRRAVGVIESRAQKDEPYFLYFPLTSPHSPIVPNDQFKGMSGAGPYGDFVCEVDWVIGEVMAALDRTGTADNTLIIFTSDNGPERQTGDDIGVYNRIPEYNHYSMGDLRGMKRDAWEGGHRVPFIARWPAVTPAGAVCDQSTVLGDLMATCADIVGMCPEEGEGEDSISMLPLLQGDIDKPVRSFAVHHSCNGRFAIRKGGWVYIDSPTGGDNEEPEWFMQQRGYRPHNLPGELFNLDDDLGERLNLYAERPEIVEELAALLKQVKGDDVSTRISQLHERFLTE